jgi:hypothetical protein
MVGEVDQMVKRSALMGTVIAITIAAHVQERSQGKLLAPEPETFVPTAVSSGNVAMQNSVTGEEMSVLPAPPLEKTWRLFGV